MNFKASFAGGKRPSGARQTSLSPPPTKRRFESATTSRSLSLPPLTSTSSRAPVDQVSLCAEKAVASFFTPISKKDPESITWRHVEQSLLVGKYCPCTPPKIVDEPSAKRRKIAAFDFDSTLIQTSSGNVFGKDSTDWRWWDPSVPTVLRQLFDDGQVFPNDTALLRPSLTLLSYILAIISNQGGISLKSDPKTVKSDQKRLSTFKAKVQLIFNQLDFPVSLYAGTLRDRFRKPRTGMWDELLDDFDLDTGDRVDLESSFFVGDAGGRPARDGAKADHSCSDRNFANNVGIRYMTPEEYFLHEAQKPYEIDLEPSVYLNTSDKVSAPSVTVERIHALDIILLCGSPGSGKSTFYFNILKPLGYERVNQDTLKSRERCLKVASDFLIHGKAVVIDNTNADPDIRQVWVRLARKYDVPIRCVYFTTPAKVCEHNDAVRAFNPGTFNPENRSILPHSAFSSFASRYKEPKTAEGFEEVVRMDFQFCGTEEQRNVWKRYWI